MARAMGTTVVGMLWYSSREDYEEMKAMFPDGGNLHETFDEWERTGKSTFRKLRREASL
jgi:hypothetical protein